MKKNLLIIGVLSIYSTVMGQVGINTSMPETTFDVHGKNHLGPVTAKDGVLVPRVSDLVANGTVVSQLVYLIGDNGTYKKGFHYWNGTTWEEVLNSSNTVTSTSGSETKKIQFMGNYNNNLTVVNGPFEFRIEGNPGNSGDLDYELRLINLPSGNVNVYTAGTEGMGGTGLNSSSSLITFTTGNWNTWQRISTISVNRNAHLKYLSVDNTNITGSSLPIFYNLLVQRVDGSGGLKTLIINRY